MAKGDWRKKPYKHVRVLESNDVSERGIRRESALAEVRRELAGKYRSVSARGNTHWAMSRKIRRAIERDAAKRRVA